MKNPYPHLYRVDGRPLPGLPPRVQRETTAACKEIRRRTGYQGWYHAPARAVQFHRGERPKHGTIQDNLMSGGRYHPLSVECACKRLWRSRRSMDEKLAAFEKAERANATARDEQLAKHADDIGGSLVDEILHQVRKCAEPHSRRVHMLS